jgi:signal transduction histidine kinase
VAVQLSSRWRLSDPRLCDAAIVAGLFGLDLTAQGLVTAGDRLSSHGLSPVTVALAAAGAGVLWWRRRTPILVLAAVIVVMLAAAALTPPGLLSDHTGIPLAVGAYSVGAWSKRRIAATAVPAAVLLLAFTALSRSATKLTAGLVALVVIALPWLAGRALRSRRQYLAEVEARLSRAEQERDRAAREAVLEERRHLARELHDVVAHHVSLIGVQAGAARSALGQSPDAIAKALLAIEESSRSAVGEMRRLLDVLRFEGTEGETGPDGLEPAPGLGRLADLAASYQQAGLTVTIALDGEVAALGSLLDLCCYRVIEEALTNVTRHSAAITASVRVTVRAPARPQEGHLVRIVVHDPGPARGVTSESGRGLVGLRERVALFGGTLQAGATPGGGFTVDASFREMAGVGG